MSARTASLREREGELAEPREMSRELLYVVQRRHLAAVGEPAVRAVNLPSCSPGVERGEEGKTAGVEAHIERAHGADIARKVLAFRL